MQDAVARLGAMGQMPSDTEDVEDAVLEEYGRLLKDIRTPVSTAEAEALVALFPETGLFGLEWTLLHIFETVLQGGGVSSGAYRGIVARCPSEEWRETLEQRFNSRGDA